MKPFSLFVFFILFSFSAWAEKGAVDVLVSQRGIPAENYEVLIDGKKFLSDAFGYVTLGLESGEHVLNIRDGKAYKNISFKVVEGERTQLLVNIFAKSIVSDLTQPEELKKKQDLSQMELGKINLQIKSINGEPIAGAKVYARGTQVTGKSDRKGNVFLDLPLGEQVLSVTHPKFSTQVVRDIKIAKDSQSQRSIELTPSGLVLEDFVVLAPNLNGSIEALIEVRRKASDVADVMSAEQMAKSGDSDAAGSLKRVTGLTLKDGKYVYVRGMGERYSATLLNGVSLPSPDPSRRVVPLDLFPVQFLDSMIIQKSYSPNQPGEFGGGVVQLQTKKMPEKFFFKASISQTQNSNDGNMKTYNGGGQDWLGVDDGARKLPDQAFQDPNVLKDNNRHNLQGQNNESLPEISFSTGNSWKMGPLKVGFNLSGLYKDHINFQSDKWFRYENSTGTLQQEEDYIREKTTKERTAGGIAGLQVELLKKHRLAFNHINLRNTTDYVAILEGTDEEGNFGRESQTEWAARTLMTNMIQGESEIPQVNNIKINWHFAESKARRDEPYRTSFVYSPNSEGEFVFDPFDDQAYLRRYYNLVERATDRGVSAETPFPWFGKRKGSLRLGLSQTLKNRESGMLRFRQEATGVPCDKLSENLDTIFTECSDSLNLANRTEATDTYNANQEINSYYFKSQWPLLTSLSLSTGMRYESSAQNVDTIDRGALEVISTELTTKNWLPGSALTWKLNKKMQMRLAYSETISRPDLRELSSSLWQDFETGFDVQGNINLKATSIRHYDARWEWYFGRRENLSFGVFYKEFTDPIEAAFSSSSDPTISFLNVDGAQTYGAELEFAKNLGFIGSWLRNFTFSGNYAQIFSDVQIGNVVTLASQETNRPLQGQSNYTANALLDYEYEKINLNTSLAYNVYGPRIAYTQPNGLPNIWEEPFHQLDFVMRKKFGKTMNVQARVRNLLNPEQRFVQGGRLWQSFRKGQTFTLGVGMEI